MTDLRLLSWKVAFLVAITLARRASELSALRVDPPYLNFHKEKVVLRTDSAFLPKVATAFHINQDIVLPAFFPSPSTPIEKSLHSLDGAICRSSETEENGGRFALYSTSGEGCGVPAKNRCSFGILADNRHCAGAVPIMCDCTDDHSKNDSYSNKKPESEASAVKKKVNKGKEGSENSDVEKTPAGSPHPEDEDDAGVQSQLSHPYIVTRSTIALMILALDLVEFYDMASRWLDRGNVVDVVYVDFSESFVKVLHDILKRRSSRQVKRKRYTEDLEFKISDEEVDDADAGRNSPSNTSQSEQQESADAEGPVVEKIMSSRTFKKQMENGQEIEAEEFYVKYKNFSYLHCQWASVEVLDKDRRIQQKIKRFKAKQVQNKFLSEIDDELFNPDYVEVDRIMDISYSKDDNGEIEVAMLALKMEMHFIECHWCMSEKI
ncbi:Chromodomain-helicase-DNA-binding protein 7 [Varanus komodoensis]|nr:Chromodomain-helicase-DNA-binding protein 7 [Varanus komodoensis]